MLTDDELKVLKVIRESTIGETVDGIAQKLKFKDHFVKDTIEKLRLMGKVNLSGHMWWAPQRYLCP